MTASVGGAAEPGDSTRFSLIEQLKNFRSFTCDHPHLRNALEEIETFFFDHENAPLLFLIGLTGVGKSTVLNRTEEDRWKSWLSLENRPVHKLPVIYQQVRSSEGRGFDWKYFYDQLLRQMDEPFIERKVLPPSVGKQRKLEVSNSRGHTISASRRSLVNALRYYEPVVILDDAQRLREAGSVAVLLRQIDALQSLVDEAGVPFVLAGTYELAEMLQRSGQLSRRSRVVHFARYTTEAGDFRCFKSILGTFQQLISLEDKNLLTKSVDFIYENSVGCIGLLAPWLERAFIRAIRTKSELVTLNILEATKPPFTILESVLHDGITGESIFNDCRFHAAANARKVHFLRRLRPDLDIVEDTASEVLPGANCSPKKRRFVGQRKPIRDNVGRPNDREKS